MSSSTTHPTSVYDSRYTPLNGDQTWEMREVDAQRSLPSKQGGYTGVDTSYVGASPPDEPDDPYSQGGLRPERTPKRRRVLGVWTLEILCLILCIGIVVAVGYLLSHFEHKRLPRCVVPHIEG